MQGQCAPCLPPAAAGPAQGLTCQVPHTCPVCGAEAQAPPVHGSSGSSIALGGLSMFQTGRSWLQSRSSGLRTTNECQVHCLRSSECFPLFEVERSHLYCRGAPSPLRGLPQRDRLMDYTNTHAQGPHPMARPFFPTCWA